MGALGELPPLRFGTWGHAKGSRRQLAPSKPKKTQPLARGRTSGCRSVSAVAQKRKFVDTTSATGETKRRREMQPHERGKEQPGGKERVCRWLDPQVSEADHFTSCQRKEFCIRCDLYRNRKDYEVAAMRQNNQSWLATGAYRGVWGHGLQNVCSIRTQPRARGFPKVKIQQIPGPPIVAMACARSASATCYIGTSSQGVWLALAATGATDKGAAFISLPSTHC